MDDYRIYKIKIHGQMEEEDILLACPLHFSTEQAGETATTFTIHTDQSGLIGLLRYLHGLGLVLLSITCEIENTP
ncbi:MAG: hypothetical protein ACM3PY_18565 [Omnitrophica WOR_2 bacterium]